MRQLNLKIQLDTGEYYISNLKAICNTLIQIQAEFEGTPLEMFHFLVLEPVYSRKEVDLIVSRKSD